MACSGVKFTTRDDWYNCISKFAPGDVRDFQCGCDPSAADPLTRPAGKSKGGSKGLVDRVIDYLTGTQNEIEMGNTGVATPDIPSTVLDPDNRPVNPGELTDNGLLPSIFYAPNKAVGGALKLVPERYRVGVAVAFPWIFWLLVGGFIVQRFRKK